jgi:hypothetical protein
LYSVKLAASSAMVFGCCVSKLVWSTKRKSVGILAPLAEAGHFLGEFEFFAAFGLDDPNLAAGVAHDEVGEVAREVAVGAHRVELEANGEVVLGEGLDIGHGFEEGCKAEFETSGMGIGDDFVEGAFGDIEVFPEPVAILRT